MVAKREEPSLKGGYSIDEWCVRWGICRASYYNLRKRGDGPREMLIGSRVVISIEADEEWRKAREAVTA